MNGQLGVQVNIGARIGASFNSAVRQAESRFEQMGRRLELTGAKMKAIGAGGFGAIGVATAAGYGVSRMMRPFVDFEYSLAHLGNIAEVHGAKLDALGKRVIKVGSDYGTGGRAALAGVQNYVAAGLSLEKSVAALPDTLLLSRVGNILPEEASSAGIAALNNMKIAQSQLGETFGQMNLAAKEGNFELGDMARYMERLTSSAMKIGYTGTDGMAKLAAMLQVVRKGAADSEQAQNNLYNLTEKMFSAETRRKFAKLGYDLEKIYADSKKNGTDYFMDVVGIVERLNKGGKNPFVFADTFEDMQAKSALQMLIEHREEYERIRKIQAKGNGRQSLVDDMGRLKLTAKFGIGRFMAGLEAIGIALGRAFGPLLGDMAERLAALAERFADWAEKHPAAIKTLGLLAGGLVGLNAVVRGGAWLLGSLIGRVGGAITAIANLWRATLGARLAFAMLARFGLGALLAVSLPVAAAIAGIALAIAWIVAKADGISAFFSGFADGFTKAFAPAAPAIEAIKAALAPLQPVFDLVAGAASKLFSWFADLFGAPAVGEWRNAGEAIGSIVGTIAAAIANLIANVTAAVSKIVTLWDTISTGPARLGRWIGEQVGIKPVGARALGGSVSAGMPYMVGERGPELMVPGRSGTVINAAAVAALNRGRGGGGNVTTGDIHFHGVQDGREAIRQFDAYLRKMASGQAVLLSD